MSERLVAFIDRDGTLIEEPDDEQVDAISKVRFVTEVIPALRDLIAHGYELVMVSNQDGLGTDSFPQRDFDIPHQWLMGQFASQGIHFAEEFICPHFSSENCNCRKPRTGLLTEFLVNNAIDAQRSCVIGDRETDLELAKALGIQGFRVGSDNKELSWLQIAERLIHRERTSPFRRKTNETNIAVTVNLDSSSLLSVKTGLGFFDHMIEQLARHGGFSLQLSCKGDLQTGPHHTIEDCALALGSTLQQALGNKNGLARFGFVLPMDEAQCQVAIDLSGRPHCEITLPKDCRDVADMPIEMVPHFFRSFSQTLNATLHIEATGTDSHHVVESLFKATGRCLRQAFKVDGHDLPTTKGLL